MKRQFDIQITDDYIIPTSGLLLIGELLQRINLYKRMNKLLMPGLSPSPKIKNGDIIHSYIGLLAQGKNDFEWIKVHRDDEFFEQSLGVKRSPSTETLRQRLDKLSKHKDIHQICWEENICFLQKLETPPTALTLSNNIKRCPLDIDHSPFDNGDTKKEGVSRTYKGVDGYNPVFAYLGQEGYIVNSRLQEGKDHVQKDMPSFLSETLTYTKQIVSERLLVRVDGGNDARINIQTFHAHLVDFIIKRNRRKESLESWLAIAQERGEGVQEREGKIVYTGKIPVQISGCDRPTFQVYQVTKRTMSRDGQIFIIPEIECQTFWTSLDVPAEEVIELYHQHGTCEQFHSELKSDMDLERFPSGKFATNHLILTLGSLTYNFLRAIGQDALKGNDMPVQKKVFRRRLQTVIKHMVMFAGKFVRHARRLILSISRRNPWRHCFIRLLEQYSP